MPLGIGMCVTALGLLWPLLVSLFLHDVLSTSASGTHKHSHLVLTKELVLRSTALCSAFAFYSFSIQVRGLIGEFGLHPITQSLETIKEYVESLHSSPSSTSPEGDNDEEPEEKEDHSSTTSVSGSRRSQTSSKSSKSTAKGSSLLFQHLSWQMFTSVDHFRAFMLSLVYEKCYAEKDITDHLQSITYVDTGVAVMAVVYPHPVLFCYLFLSYYAYKRVSGPFLNFQWDVLLLEMLFMSALLAMASQVWQIEVGIWTMRLLLLRLMLGSGLVKAYGQDESWHTSYTAMNYHFLTTPLPNTWSRWVSLYAPDAMLKLMTVGTLVAEIHFPLATLLGIEWLNYGIFWAYVALQLSICTTGYYGKLC